MLSALQVKMGADLDIGKELRQEFVSVTKEIAQNELQMFDNVERKVKAKVKEKVNKFFDESVQPFSGLSEEGYGNVRQEAGKEMKKGEESAFAQSVLEVYMNELFKSRSMLPEKGYEKVKKAASKEMQEGEEFSFAQNVAETYIKEFFIGKIGEKPTASLKALTQALENLSRAKDEASQKKAEKDIETKASAFFDSLVNKQTGLSTRQRKVLQTLLKKELTNLSQGQGVVVSTGEAVIKHRKALAKCMWKISKFYIEKKIDKKIKEMEASVAKEAKEAGVGQEFQDFKSAALALDNPRLSEEEASAAEEKLWSAMESVAKKTPGILWNKGMNALGVAEEMQKREVLEKRKAELQDELSKYIKNNDAFAKIKNALAPLGSYEEKILHLRLLENKAEIQREKLEIDLELAKLGNKAPEPGSFLKKRITQQDLNKELRKLVEKQALYTKVLEAPPILDAGLLPESKSIGFVERKQYEIKIRAEEIKKVKEANRALTKEIEALKDSLKKPDDYNLEKMKAKRNLPKKEAELEAGKLQLEKLEEVNRNIQEEIEIYNKMEGKKESPDKLLTGVEGLFSEYGGEKIKERYAHKGTFLPGFKAMFAKADRPAQLEYLQKAFAEAAQLKEQFKEDGQEITGAETARNLITRAAEEVASQIAQEERGSNSKLLQITKEIMEKSDKMRPALGPNPAAAAEPEPKPKPRPKAGR